MKNNNKMTIKKNIFFSGALLLVLCYFILLGFTIQGSDSLAENEQAFKRTGTLTEFYDKWRLSSGDTTIFTNMDGAIDGVNAEHIKISKELPKTLGKNETFVFSTSNVEVNVFVDDVLSYTYDPYQTSNAKFSIEVWHSIHLKQSDANKLVRIELTQFNNAKMTIRNIMIGPSDLIIEHVHMENFLLIVFSIGLIFLGVYLLAVQLFEFAVSRNLSRNNYLSLLTISMGVWGIAGSDLAFLVYPFNNLLCVIYLAVVSLIPLFYLGFIRSFKSNRFKKLLDVLTILSIAINFITALCLAVGNEFILMLRIVNAVLISFSFIIHFFRSREFYLSNSQIRKYYSSFLMSFFILILSFISSFFVGVTAGKAYSLIALIGYFIFILVFISIEYILSVKLIENEKIISEKVASQLVSLSFNQIKPHFLHNTLTSIRYLIKSNPSQAYALITNFSEYLKTNLNAVGMEECISWADEIKNIKTYVKIEKVRFGDRINVAFILNEMNFKVPALSIQPLVENAIKHGICKRIEGGTVVVKSYQAQGHNIVEIKDDGVGFSSNDADSSENHVGLENSMYRLQKLTKASVHVQSAPNKGTHVIIKIPVEDFTE